MTEKCRAQSYRTDLPGLIVTLGFEIDLGGAPGLGAQRAAVPGDLEERQAKLPEEVCILPDAGFDWHCCDSDRDARRWWYKAK